MSVLPVLYFAFQVLSNYSGLVQQGIHLDYVPLYWLNYGVYLILFLFGTIFINGFVLSIWLPVLLHLPDEMNKESTKKHILISIPIGLLIGSVLTLISSTTSYFLWMN